MHTRPATHAMVWRAAVTSWFVMGPSLEARLAHPTASTGMVMASYGEMTWRKTGQMLALMLVRGHCCKAWPAYTGLVCTSLAWRK